MFTTTAARHLLVKHLAFTCRRQAGFDLALAVNELIERYDHLPLEDLMDEELEAVLADCRA
jgi:hypothetical protein